MPQLLIENINQSQNSFTTYQPITGEPGVRVRDEGRFEPGPDHHERGGPEVPHPQHGRPWRGAAQGRVLRRRDHVRVAGPPQGAHRVQVVSVKKIRILSIN